MCTWKNFPEKEITQEVTSETVKYAKDFGTYLGTDVKEVNEAGKTKIVNAKLTTSQLRRFFGEVKRQQMNGYNKSTFVLLKPKLAYAVGRTKGKSKITDFYDIMSIAIDLVTDEKSFKRFIQIFEAIVAYHKAAEESK